MGIDYRNIKMANFTKQFATKPSNDITFSVTQDCQLVCKYCYMTGKNNIKNMSFDIAKKAIDYILDNRDIYSENSVIWNFIGGEPLLEIDLIDTICDYIKQQMYILDHPWFNNYRFSISTNGILYGTEKVQKFIKKNKEHLSIGISVDGNKEKHDNQRIYPNGRGSYDDVIKNIPLWKKQFPDEHAVKATFSHGDIHLIKDSIINLWNLGITDVSANVVFEDVWDENDPIIFEKQLKELGDYVLENDLINKVSVRFLDPNIGFPENDKTHGFCGSGKMLSIDSDGNFYSCTRFMKFTLNNKKELKVGDIYNGVNTDMLKAFKQISIQSISPEKCLKCNVASGCAACSGLNYDESVYGSVLERSTNICEMHKANVRAVEYFWDEFAKKNQCMSIRDIIRNERLKYNPRYMQIITADDIKPICNYTANENNNSKMDEKLLLESIKFSKLNNYIPVILGENRDFKNILTINSDSKLYNDILVHDNDIHDIVLKNNILLINKDNIENITEIVGKMAMNDSNIRINISYPDFKDWTYEDLNKYSTELDKLIGFINDNNYYHLSINIFEDSINKDITNIDSCEAGESLLAIAPNKMIYFCPAIYFNFPELNIGNIDDGIDENKLNLFISRKNRLEKNSNCKNCNKCIYVNKKKTNEFFISSDIQNKIAELEIKKAKKLKELIDKGI